ncbi:hypothetical protein C7974DRAFT_152722 [Boeremia exigua]|uniref:uncharacterized protein n=1 Tax=Boeremia exigua TaxID=749465 RepID=UPI001E8D2A58|nr:uncharacterized protein C7974DRAFT_152722 [Boeremia exigua]KAH6638030.1 hypothetical protein C7974DRAFT_152722 [Boeremia exigua]
MSDVTPGQVERLDRHRRLQIAMELVLAKLRHDAESITTVDAQILADHAEDGDQWTADIIAAVADLAIRNEDGESALEDDRSSMVHLPNAVEDLHAAVKANPKSVTTDVLRTTQSIVSIMQKAIGHTNAPHPELEAELQQEYAKIIPKVERGIVTKAEADRLHSLEARAHGHTERGGLTAIAQSVVARRQRQVSISSASPETRPRIDSRIFMPHRQLHHKADADLPETETEIRTVHIDTAGLDSAHSRRQRSPEKSAVVPSNSSMRRYYSLSDSTNATRGDSRHDVTYPKFHNYGSADTGGGDTENSPHTNKRENDQPVV